MKQQWQVNDLALCIKQGLWCDGATGEYVTVGPKAGQILTVARVARSWQPQHRGELLLGFAEHGRDYFAANRFVKIEPDEADEIDEQCQIDLDLGLPAELVEARL